MYRGTMMMNKTFIRTHTIIPLHIYATVKCDEDDNDDNDCDNIIIIIIIIIIEAAVVC